MRKPIETSYEGARCAVRPVASGLDRLLLVEAEPADILFRTTGRKADAEADRTRRALFRAGAVGRGGQQAAGRPRSQPYCAGRGLE